MRHTADLSPIRFNCVSPLNRKNSLTKTKDSTKLRITSHTKFTSFANHAKSMYYHHTIGIRHWANTSKHMSKEESFIFLLKLRYFCCSNYLLTTDLVEQNSLLVAQPLFSFFSCPASTFFCVQFVPVSKSHSSQFFI